MLTHNYANIHHTTINANTYTMLTYTMLTLTLSNTPPQIEGGMNRKQFAIIIRSIDEETVSTKPSNKHASLVLETGICPENYLQNRLQHAQQKVANQIHRNMCKRWEHPPKIMSKTGHRGTHTRLNPKDYRKNIGSIKEAINLKHV